MPLCVNTSRRSALSAGLAAAVWLSGCGLAGLTDRGGGGGGNSPPLTPPQSDDALGTHVSLHDMRYKELSLGACLDQQVGQELTELGSNFAADGVFVEWDGVSPFAEDPLADANAGLGIGLAYVAKQNEDLLLAVAGPASTAVVHVEFGGIAVRGSRLERQVRRLLRVQQGRLEDFQNGVWHSVPDSQGRHAWGADGVELWLSARLLGDAVTWPSWWVRVYTKEGADDEHAADATHAAPFTSLLAADTNPFVISRCERWSGGAAPMRFIELSQTEPSPPAPLPHEPLATQPAELPRAQLGFQLARFAFNDVSSLFAPEEWPLQQLAVITTSDDGSAAPQLMTPVAAHELPYLGLVVDMRPLDPASIDPFPMGTIVPQLERELLELVLGHLYPQAPPALRYAVRTALLDHLMQRAFGLSFWLDRFPGMVAAGIPDEGPYLALSDRGARAFGHLLAAHFSAPVLVEAWRIAAANDRAASLEGAVDAFGAALRAVMDTPEGHVRVAGLSAGWLDASAFDPRFHPAQLGDPDGDGLPSFLEALAGTDSLLFDTDGDGWSDLAELILGDGALAVTRTPMRLMPDGSFNDWLELLPKRIHIDKGHSGACPKAADIFQYAAVATPDTLHIGAVASEFWESEPRAKWEGVIDLPLVNKQFLITADSGTRAFVVKDPATNTILKRFERAMPMARKTIEWVIHRQDLGLDKPIKITTSRSTNAVQPAPPMVERLVAFDEKEGVSIRLRTVFHEEGDRFCDETAWFVPYVSR